MCVIAGRCCMCGVVGLFLVMLLSWPGSDKGMSN